MMKFFVQKQRIELLERDAIAADQIAFVEKAITEGTNGRAKMKKEKDLYYSVIDGEVKVFTD